MEEYIKRLSIYQKPDLENVEEVTSAEYYYDPRCHLSTHEQLINDYETMNAFKGWIEDNKHLIKDKVVLDVGCGIGIFSLIAAEAGAARVISFEWSNIARYTKKIVKDNNLDHIITIIKGHIDSVKLPDGIEKVDVIISMWLGYSLFQGGRLKTVIQARDKWLKREGVIIPDCAQLYIAAICDDEFREQHINWWKNVYGHDMSCVSEESLKYAVYCVLPPSKIVTNKCELKNIDLKRQSYSEIMKEVPFMITAKQNDYVQGFCTFFTVKFSADIRHRELNTDPLLTPKHLGQTCFYEISTV